MLSPLSTSDYTVSNNIEFINHIKNIDILQGEILSLFINVPLYDTIDLVLKRIYDDKEMSTNITKLQMKELFVLCTKNVHFSFDNQIYQQCDGVAMESPLGPVLAGIFMVSLENTLMPKLSEHMGPWKRYVDDTITTIKPQSIEYFMSILNSFHKI